MVDSVQLVAHRGDPVRAPENTMASWESAAARGAGTIEVDLRRTADGEWIVIHDSTLRRTAGTKGRVSRKRWRLLSRLDVGSWFSARFEKERIPSLKEALAFCKRKKLSLFLDLKVARHEKEILRVVRTSGWSDHVLIGAGTAPSLRRWRALDGKIPLYWVTGFRGKATSRRLRRACRLKVTGLAMYKKRLTKQTVERIHDAGLKIYVWTAVTASELRKFSCYGVDGIMSEVWPPL